MYTIPCDHAGGTFWYHPHHHGSTSLQMGGGAMGALIIEDRVDVHGIPDQIAAMPELVLTIQEMYPQLSIADSEASGDALYNTTAVQRCGKHTCHTNSTCSSAVFTLLPACCFEEPRPGRVMT